MATISRLREGQVVYDRRTQQAGNTKMRRVAVWQVVIKEIDPEGKWVIASWNGNAARKFYPSSVKRWLVNDPRRQ